MTNAEVIESATLVVIVRGMREAALSSGVSERTIGVWRVRLHREVEELASGDRDAWHLRAQLRPGVSTTVDDWGLLGRVLAAMGVPHDVVSANIEQVKGDPTSSLSLELDVMMAHRSTRFDRPDLPIEYRWRKPT